MSWMTRFRGRSFAELRVRGTQLLAARFERLASTLRAPSFEMDDEKSGSEWPAADLSSALPGLTGSLDELKWLVMLAAKSDPEFEGTLRRKSDQLLSGSIDLLGMREFRVGNPPQWRCDPLTKTTVPLIHWSRLNALDTTTFGDHKFLWELNRHQYLLAPAMQWLVTGDRRHSDVVSQHLSSWLDQNPPGLGPNWVSSLEVAYRALSWCWLLSLQREADWPPDLRRRMIGGLRCHARHIARHLSYYFSPNTHLTGEALALFYLGTLLPESRETSSWRSTGARILEDCVVRQVFDDGVYFEQATQYQRYTADIYLHYLALARASNWPVSDCLTARLLSLLEVLRSCCDGNGRIPLLGDDDGGYLLPLDLLEPDDCRATLTAGAIALAAPQLYPPANKVPTMALWLFGQPGTKAAHSEIRVNPAYDDMYFKTGGLVTLRNGWRVDAAVATIDAGPHGSLNCGHAHSDALSMTLSLGTRPVFVDRGTLTYVGDERNMFRSTESHNTLEFDGQSSVEPRGPFQWNGVPPRPAATVRAAPEVVVFEGRSIGHVTTVAPSLHHRVVVRTRGGSWMIFDQGRRHGMERSTVRWQLGSNVDVRTAGPNEFALMDKLGVSIARLVVLGSTDAKVISRSISTRYGRATTAPCIEISGGQQPSICTILIPEGQAGSATSSECAGSSSAVQMYGWSDVGGNHRIMLATSGAHPFVQDGTNVSCRFSWHSDVCLQRESKVPGSEILLMVTGERSQPDHDAAQILQRSHESGWKPLELKQCGRGSP
jgi:hypothetical protein